MTSGARFQQRFQNVFRDVDIVLAAVVFIYTAWRYDLMHRPSVATKPHRPDMAPPGQQAIPPYDEEQPTEAADSHPPR